MFCHISHLTFQGYSCADLYGKGLKESGIYYLQIDGTKYWFLKTYCDMEAAAGGWTVSGRGEIMIPNARELASVAGAQIWAGAQDYI